MAYSSHPSEPDVPGDVLPPVEPPNAGFILQLFVVPGIIVTIIVGVWLLFHWVVRTGSDPQEFVRALQRRNESSFQAAKSLADMLRTPGEQSAALRKDQKTAHDLATILDAEIESAGTNEQSVTLRIYLCAALGEFETPEGLPQLLRAASAQRSEEEIEVRLAALRAIAVLANNLRRTDADASLATPEVEKTLLEASHESDPRVRGTAAFVLGVVGGEKLNERLAAMLGDSNADVRYNAAIEAAAHGNAEAIPVLAEMLDPDEAAGTNLEQDEKVRPYKRAMIVRDALVGAKKLAVKNRTADFAPLRQQLERLLATNPNQLLKVEVDAVLAELPPPAE